MFIPQRFYTALKAIGYSDWLTIGETRTDDLGHTCSEYHVDNTKVQAALSVAYMMGEVNEMEVNDFKRLCKAAMPHHIRLLSRMFAEGPKVFCPTVEQCEAMANVAVDLTLADYQQPYPVFVVSMPREYIERNGGPAHIAVMHDSKQQMLVTLCDNIVDGDLVHFTTMSAKSCFHTIEEAITTMRTDARPEAGFAEVPAYRRAERIALNCCLLLTQYRIRLQAIHGSFSQRLRDQLRSDKPKAVRKAQRQLAGEFQQVILDQQVSWFDSEGGGHDGDPKNLWHVRAHWRKGHWRRQPCGVARTERKLVFIRPVLVHCELVADTSTTNVTYVA